jgi:flagellin-like protein
MKLSTKKNDGVSPVIGTILLVAITVVLVAIISAVVMGMTGGIGTTHTVGIQLANDASSSSHNVSITFLSGDVSALQNLTVYNATGSTVTLIGPFSIGPKYSATVGVAGSQTVTVVGVFSDGNQTLVKQTVVVS